MSDPTDGFGQPTVRQMYDAVTDSLAEDCYTNNPPELAVLEGAYFGYQMREHLTIELVDATIRAVDAGLLRETPDGCSRSITEAGQLRLAELWGDHRVPPNKGGHVDCWEHGTYVAAPGDLWTCPEDTRTDDEVLRDLAEDPVIGGAMTLADADAVAVADRMIRQFEAQEARRRTVRLLLRHFGVGLVIAAVAVLVWLFADAIF